ncbi:carboxymuconolactone decarboxylase family protein [Streptomyces sp. NPDC003247]|uniref:carboxymuconolactone decarboxylase family protein n=1 Tax=Streptomyces sp. NPDC003247 TaxID=3364677 RepID=UPI0036AAA064
MRLTPLRDESAEQARLRTRLLRERGGVHGPFQVLLRSPTLGDPLERLSTSCLAESALPPRLRELTLLTVARLLDAQHSWLAHVGKGRAAGLDPAALDRLARGEDPGFVRRDERLLHRFVHQALTRHFVDDDTYAAARGEFGEAALVDLTVSLGTFAALALLLNVFEVDLPPDATPPFPDVTTLPHGRRTTNSS